MCIYLNGNLLVSVLLYFSRHSTYCAYCSDSNVTFRDQQIERLTWEVNQLRRELARVKAEDQMVIESLHNRVHELEMELNDLQQIAESTTTVSLCNLLLLLHWL